MTCSEIIGGDDPELEELDDPTRIPREYEKISVNKILL